MKLLWVKADKIGSKIIRWGLDSDCSHFAVCFDEGDGASVGRGIAFHSYGTGTQLAWLNTFLKHYTVVHALEPIGAVDEEAVYRAVLESEDDRPYDYPGLFWFTWRGILYKLLGWSVDGINRWQRQRARLCTGVAPAVLSALGVEIKAVDAEMVPPHELYLMVKGSGRFSENEAWRDLANLV